MMYKSECYEIDTLLEEDFPQVTPTIMIWGKVKVKAETIFECEAMKEESETISGEWGNEKKSGKLILNNIDKNDY